MTAPDPYRNEVVLGEDNEAFRVFDEPEGIPPTAAGEPLGGHTVYGRSDYLTHQELVAWLGS